MKLITIGIPSFNRPEAAKDSLMNLLQSQILSSNSILLANNGSTAEYQMAELQKNYGQRFKYLKFEENLGYGLNLIRLIEQCETKYLLFMSDEDDLTESGFNNLSSLLTAKNPTLVILRNERNKSKSLYKINQNSIKGASSYISGIIVNVEILQIHMDLLKHLVQTEEFAALYPQVVISTLLNSIESGYIMRKPSIIKRVVLPTTVTSKNGTPYWYPTERVWQHLSFQRCILELYKNTDSETKKQLMKLSKTLDSNFFGLICDAIWSISPDLLPIFIRSSFKTIINFYFKLSKNEIKRFLLKIRKN
jgi:glycosyltransferase involved in cell wall biosynthesis